MEKDNARQKRLATISRLCKNVQACRAEKAETKIKQMEDAIKFDFERFMDFQRRAEQAEAQCALLKQENSKLAMASIEQPPYKQDLIDRMKRMEDALKMARPALVNADSDTSFIAHRYSHALTAANCPLTEAELLKTSGMCRAAEKAVKAALEEKP